MVMILLLRYYPIADVFGKIEGEDHFQHYNFLAKMFLHASHAAYFPGYTFESSHNYRNGPLDHKNKSQPYVIQNILFF